MLNIAMLSRWHVHATEYALEAGAQPGVKITAVWDDIEERGKKWAAELGADFEGNIDILLERRDVDAVIITSATNQHKELMFKAARAGKHIFTEKVMAPYKKDCEEIASVIRENDIKFCISMPRRGFPESLFAKEVVEDGILGDITLLRIRNAHNGATANWLPEYFYDPECCGGGAMIDLGAHGMYLCRWLLGKPVSIISMFNNNAGFEVEDNAVSVIQFENGALAVTETGFVSACSPYSLELYGKKGSLLIGGPENKVMLKSDIMGEAISGWKIVDELPEPLPTPLQQWIGAIVNGTSLIYGLEEGIDLTELIEGAYSSYIEGKKVYFRQ